MVTIYVLSLELGKYYVGKTEHLDNRIMEHIQGTGSEWTKLYKFIKVIITYENCDDYDEDKYTVMMMNKYGIDNVRGGSFCKIHLDTATIGVITNMLRGTNNKCLKCGSDSHFAKECPIKIEPGSGSFVAARSVNNGTTSILSRLYNYVMGYSKPKNPTYNRDASSDSNDSESDDDKCYRCGRDNHFSKDCYAAYDVDGNLIDDKCYKCGREGHFANECYSKYHVNGKRLH